MWDPMFVPPRHHRGLYWFARTFVPHLGRLFGNVHSLELSPEAESHLAAVAGGPAILCPNHPTETDPIVMFWLSRRMRHYYNFLATRETLDGPRGRLLNRIGVYSVIRGYPDRESIRFTRRLLSQDDRQVVIFPEGLVYEHNDRLLEFQPGVAQIGFWALEDRVKDGKPAALPLVPIAIRYRCLRPGLPAIRAGLSALETRLAIRDGAQRPDYDRLIAVGSAILTRVEAGEGLAPDDTLDLSARITRARGAILQRVATRIGAEVDPQQSAGDQLHGLYNSLKAWVGVLDKDAAGYDERLYRQRAETARPLFAELLRLQNVVALDGSYVRAEPTTERFLEVLGRLELEVLGRVRSRVPLGALVTAAPPIRLQDHHDEYRAAKRETVARVTQRLRADIREMLDGLRGHATPLE